MYEFILGCFYGGLGIGCLGLLCDHFEHKKLRRKVVHMEDPMPEIFNHRHIEDYVFTIEGEE